MVIWLNEKGPLIRLDGGPWWVSSVYRVEPQVPRNPYAAKFLVAQNLAA